MTLEIPVREHEARLWLYFLRKRYNSRAELPRLAKMAILTEVANGAQVELDDAEKEEQSKVKIRRNEGSEAQDSGREQETPE